MTEERLKILRWNISQKGNGGEFTNTHTIINGICIDSDRTPLLFQEQEDTETKFGNEEYIVIDRIMEGILFKEEKIIIKQIVIKGD